MVGIAIPALFFIGISDGNQKKSLEQEVKQVMPTDQVSIKPAVKMLRELSKVN